MKMTWKEFVSDTPGKVIVGLLILLIIVAIHAIITMPIF